MLHDSKRRQGHTARGCSATLCTCQPDKLSLTDSIYVCLTLILLAAIGALELDSTVELLYATYLFDGFTTLEFQSLTQKLFENRENVQSRDRFRLVQVCTRCRSRIVRTRHCINYATHNVRERE